MGLFPIQNAERAGPLDGYDDVTVSIGSVIEGNAFAIADESISTDSGSVLYLRSA